ncbi:transcription factor WRKY19-like [Nymphaea colorata]|nr:transcription factor WRKY19-like [Nymphaea colorata]
MPGEEKGLKQEKLLGELNQGRQLANQLLNLFASPAVEDDGVLRTQRALVEAVVRSFDTAILVLRPVGGPKTAGNQDGGDGGGDLGSPKREKPQTKERGGSKRRKVEQMETTTRVIPALHYDDGYAWRKYGQKDILGSGHPRNYFRCTHKLDQGCPAQKQVQKLDHDPSLIQVTYMGSHTCKLTRVIQEMDGADPSDDQKQGFLLNFETNSMPSGFSFSSFAFLKQEENETLNESTTTPSNRTGCTSSPDFDAGESDHIFKELDQVGLDDGDGVCSFPELDMGVVSFLEFEDLDQSLEFFSS